MLRSVYFEGELGDKFIPYMEIDCESPVQVFKCLDANFPDFKEYMIEKEEQGVGYHIEIEGNELEYVEELLMKTGLGYYNYSCTCRSKKWFRKNFGSSSYCCFNCLEPCKYILY